MAERMMGPIVGADMNLLIAVLERTWRELPCEVDKLIISPSHYGDAESKIPYHDTRTRSFGFKTQEYDGLSYKERLAHVCDPSNIPALETLLERSRRHRATGAREASPTSHSREQSLQIPSDRRSIDISHAGNGLFKLPIELTLLIFDFLPEADIGNAVVAFQLCLPDLYWRNGLLRKGLRQLFESSSKHRTTKSAPVVCRQPRGGVLELPLELQLHILDYVPEVSNIGNAVLAFQWSLPDSYWKRRFLCDEFYEVEDVPPDDLNWDFLFVEFGKLLKLGPWGLRNRQRIFRILRYTRDQFFAARRGELILEPMELKSR